VTASPGCGLCRPFHRPCAASAFATPTAAADAKGTPHLSAGACADASEQGQERRDEGHLKSARERFVTCASQVCPKIIQKDCATFLADVDVRLPSVVFQVKDAENHDLINVRVFVDGVLFTDTLDGKAIPLDPGPHVVRYEGEGAKSVEEKIVLLEGEKRRALSAVLKPIAPMPVLAPGTRTVPVLPIVLGGVGLAGGAVFAGLAFSAQSEYDKLVSSCAPRCSESVVSPVRTKLLAANVSLGVGLAALGTAAVLLLVQGPTKSASRPTPSFGIAPLPGGAAAVFSAPLPFD